MQETYLFISEVAHLLNVESHVLRYWEEELELNIKRNEFGHRCYSEKDIQFFMQVKELKDEGYPLKAIKTFLKKPGANLIPMPKREAAASRSEEPSLSPRNAAPAPTIPLSERTSMLPTQPALRPAPALSSATPVRSLSSAEKMEQFQAILNRIVSNALQANNEALGQEVGLHVSERVLKEMDYLMRNQEENMEAHFQSLDQAIREQLISREARMKNRRKAKREKREKQSRKDTVIKDIALRETAVKEAAAALDDNDVKKAKAAKTEKEITAASAEERMAAESEAMKETALTREAAATKEAAPAKAAPATEPAVIKNLSSKKGSNKKRKA